MRPLLIADGTHQDLLRNCNLSETLAIEKPLIIG